MAEGSRLVHAVSQAHAHAAGPAHRPEAERDAAAEVAQAKRWERGIGKKEEREKGKEAGEVGKRKGWREKKVVGPGTPRTGSRSGTTPEAG